MTLAQQTPLVDLSPAIIGDPVVEKLARHLSTVRGFNPDNVINHDRQIVSWMINADTVAHLLEEVRRLVPDFDARAMADSPSPPPAP